MAGFNCPVIKKGFFAEIKVEITSVKKVAEFSRNVVFFVRQNCLNIPVQLINQ